MDISAVQEYLLSMLLPSAEVPDGGTSLPPQLQKLGQSMLYFITCPDLCWLTKQQII